MQYEKLTYDVVIVGAGPAGLSAAIRLKQGNADLSVCVLEKGAQVGAHLLSGAVLKPSVLQQLFPDSWQDAPLNHMAKEDFFYYLSSKRAWRLPTPSPMKNSGNYLISLGQLCRWLAQQAETLGVDIFPGFAGKALLYDDNKVIGVMTGDKGIDKEGKHTPSFQPGIALHAPYTLLAEGCRGSLSEVVMKKFQLRAQCQPQTYGLGLKEIWQVDSSHYVPGTVEHTVGWPLDNRTYGGSFIYHLSEQQVALGFVIGLDYQNPWLNTFKTFQQFKTHPHVAKLLTGGQRLAYGARALNEGGYQAIPQLTFPGGALLGCTAGFINVPAIKGIHHAMHSGVLAAETVLETFTHEKPTLEAYSTAINEKIAQDLYRVRNIRPAFRYGLWVGLAYAAVDTYLLRGRAPWTWHYQQDYESLNLSEKSTPLQYPQPDGALTFDLSSSLYLSNVYHDENQPCHLQLSEPEQAIAYNYQQYASPEQRYCPAGVYEIHKNAEPHLQINAQNCLHCKACDIKDPLQNIHWLPAEGGGGPNYSDM